MTVQVPSLEPIRDLSEKRALAVLLVTHDFAVASQVSHSINVMYAGAIVETGPTRSVLRSPTYPYTRGLLGRAPRMDPRVRPMPTLSGSVTSAWSMTEGCRFAPRCGFAERQCLQKDPTIEEVSLDHEAACWVFA